MMLPMKIGSIGYVAGSVHAPPSLIRRVAQELGIQPTMEINGIEHFSADDIEKIAQAINRIVASPAPR